MSPRTQRRLERVDDGRRPPIRRGDSPGSRRVGSDPPGNRALAELYGIGRAAPPGLGPARAGAVDREADAGVPTAADSLDGGLPVAGVPLPDEGSGSDAPGALPISPADAEALAQQLYLVRELVASGQVELPPEQRDHLARASEALRVAADIAATPAADQSQGDLAQRAALYAAIGAVFGSIIRVIIFLEGRGFPMLLPATARSLAQTPVNFALDFSLAYSGSGDTGFVRGQVQHVATVTGGAATHNAIMAGLQRLGLSGAGRLTVPVSLVWTQLPMAMVGAGLHAATDAALQLRSEVAGESVDPIEHAAAHALATGLTVSAVAGTAEAIKAGADIVAEQSRRAGLRPAGGGAVEKDPAFGKGTVRAIRSLIADPATALKRAAAAVKRGLKNLGPTLKKAVRYARIGARAARTWIVALLTFVLPAIQDFIARFRNDLGQDDRDRLMDLLMAMLEGRSAPSAELLGEATDEERELANYDQVTLIKETVALIDRVLRLPGAAEDLSIYGIEAIRRRTGLITGSPIATVPMLATLGMSDQEVILRAEQGWDDFGDAAWDILEILGRMAGAAGVSVVDLVGELTQGVASDASRPSPLDVGFCSPDGATGMVSAAPPPEDG